MPFEYKIFPEQHLILERLWGRVTALELKQFTKEIWADEAYDKSYSGIIDLTEVEFDMKQGEIMAFIEFLFTSPDASEGRVAIVVSRPMETALSFLYQSKTAMKNDVAVFSTWESVQDFLHLPDTMVRQLAGRS